MTAMSHQNGCRSEAFPESCSSEVFPPTSAGTEDTSSQYVLFDDLALTQNLVTSSAIFPAGGSNTARVSGVVINQSAAATVSFFVQVSDEGETWTTVGSFNVSTVGSFSSNDFALNARLIQVVATTASVAIVVVWAVLERMFK